MMKGKERLRRSPQFGESGEIKPKEHAREYSLIDNLILYLKNLFTKSTYFSLGNEQGELDLTHSDFSFIISGLDTDEPKMKGSLGETPLYVLWRTENVIYFAELTS